MSRNIRFRPSAAEQRRRVQAALNMYSAEDVDIGAATAPSKPKRSVARPTRLKRAFVVRAPKAFKLTAPVPLERDVLPGVLKYLQLHPAVAWVGRVNSGGAQDERGQYVRFNTIVGCSDLIGQLKTGQFMAVEVKRPGERPTPEQARFLALVESNGGCAGWADSVDAAVEMMRRWTARA